MSVRTEPPARTTAGAERGAADRAPRTLLVAAVVAAVLLGLAAGWLASGRQPVIALLTPLLLVPLLLWRQVQAGLVILLAGVVLIEQFTYFVGEREGAFTSTIPFFSSISPGTGIYPGDVLLLMVTVIWVLQCVRDRRPLLHSTPLARRLLAYCALVAVYFVVGLARGGDLAIAVTEVRPFVYLGLCYVLAASVLVAERTITVLLWVFVLGSASKAAYGVLIFLSIRSLDARPEAVLSHEESFFFGLYVFLTLGAWLFGVEGRLRTVATWLLPIVVLANAVNSRRTAWAILVCGSLLLMAVCYVAVPARRHVLRRVAAAGLVVLVVYLPLFWERSGTLAQPARALRSVVAPDPRDAQSDEYRYLENANLEQNIRASGSTGVGFGIPIDYAIPIPDITTIASLISHVPHNGLYWLWFRTGILGQVLFWLVVAEALAAASRLARASSGVTALLGALTASAVVAYVIMGEVDLGLYWYRLAVCMGLLLGAVEARSRVVGVARPVLSARRPGTVAERARSA